MKRWHPTIAGSVKQDERLTAARYPSMVITSVCESVLQDLNPNAQDQQVERDSRKVQVIPYLRKISPAILKRW
ncbi:hypothetical protein HPB50_026703 [Hyalomma asiaticum]|uniref:Uncharacterized protein n=1 Tax=Hyalomma asiaticum TaxID=266040 RepID=A0ACB7T5Z2_HYAAI|nr:hypothetical protein HPB50_026703 [Hyalomma asiaticum]